jgi:hypothetical protein
MKWRSSTFEPELFLLRVNIQEAKYLYYVLILWHAVAQLVEALRYKPEGRCFFSR